MIIYCEWLAMKPGFLTGSFPEEPWTRLHNEREKKKDYEVDLQCLEILKFSLFYEVIVDRWMYDLWLFQFQ